MKRNTTKSSTLIPKGAIDRTKDPKAAKAVANIRANYPHADLRHGLWYVPAAKKNLVVATCRRKGCKRQHAVFTSDLFQVRYCPLCAVQQKAK